MNTPAMADLTGQTEARMHSSRHSSSGRASKVLTDAVTVCTSTSTFLGGGGSHLVIPAENDDLYASEDSAVFVTFIKDSDHPEPPLPVERSDRSSHERRQD